MLGRFNECIVPAENGSCGSSDVEIVAWHVPPPLSPNSCRVMLGSLMEELLNAFLAGLNLWAGGGNAIFVASDFNLKEIISAPCGMSVYPCFEADG